MALQRTFNMSGIAAFLLSLTACGGIDLQSDSQAITVGAASTTSSPAPASTSTKSSAIRARSGSQQQRDCLHCAP
jgi:hypothetical protein